MSDDTRAIADKECRQTGADGDEPWGRYAPNGLQRILIATARNSPLRRGLFRRTVTRLIMGLTGNPLDVRFRDCAYRLHGRNNLIEYGILLSPGYNAHDIDFLLDGSSEGDNFVDIGSNVGLYALPLARQAGETGLVVAIDANPLMASRLRRNAEGSGLDNVRIFACGVSDRDGSANLAIRKEDIAIVSLEETDNGDIPVRTLKSIVNEVGLTSIHGLKIDIEGHEDKALAPFLDEAPDTLLQRRIVIEHPLPDEDYPGCEAAFRRRGYRLAGRTGNNSLYLHQPS